MNLGISHRTISGLYSLLRLAYTCRTWTIRLLTFLSGHRHQQARMLSVYLSVTGFFQLTVEEVS